VGGLFAGDKLPILLAKSKTSTAIINAFACDKQLFASDIVLLTSDIVLITCDNYAFRWQVKIFC